MKEMRLRRWPLLGAMVHEFPVGPDEAQHLISLLRRFDLHAVQLGVPLLEEIMAGEERMATWRTKLEAAALPILALGGYRNLIAPEKTKREANIAFLQRCLEIAPQFGTTVVATETGTYNRESDWASSPENQGQEAWDTLCATLHELLPVAEQHGTILALEGHVNHVINTPERLARLLEHFPTPHLQVVLDPFNKGSFHNRSTWIFCGESVPICHSLSSMSLSIRSPRSFTSCSLRLGKSLTCKSDQLIKDLFSDKKDTLVV